MKETGPNNIVSAATYRGDYPYVLLKATESSFRSVIAKRHEDNMRRFRPVGVSKEQVTYLSSFTVAFSHIVNIQMQMN